MNSKYGCTCLSTTFVVEHPVGEINYIKDRCCRTLKCVFDPVPGSDLQLLFLFQNSSSLLLVQVALVIRKKNDGFHVSFIVRHDLGDFFDVW